ncbi:aminodeoxychorismate synthase component I [Vallitalea okinawensis]|uniref:aminodeoxychorismate synthase component I n=1 Tax=Vallitalea okinawensis TaxID=2078660 RepID=UPI000CFB3F79|nr:aminodeoxychorismate synthase component I [Vallitalea okinawensis]
MLNYHIAELKTELDPFQLYTLFHHERESVILESSMHNNGLGDFSIIAFHPVHHFSYENDYCNCDGRQYKGNVFEELDQFIKQYKLKNDTGLPFVGGAIGYLSYDLKDAIEKLPSMSNEMVSIPLCYFNIYDSYILIDHKKNKHYVCCLGVRGESKVLCQQIIAIIEASIDTSTKMIGKEDKETFISPFTRDSYMEAVEEMRQFIKKGHIYIANMTHTYTCETNKDSRTLYQHLRQINPAPFSAYLPLGDFSIVSSSPERFLKVRDGIVEARPIKGTRPRGNNVEEDQLYKKELLESEKDKSELLMIVDLERNDLSKVCKPGTVEVTELFKLEAYPTVYHLVSTVKGALKENTSIVDLLKATFPGGSITGAPKIRAMEVIEELEVTKRNIYTGSVGYIGFDGNADFNIVIRTVLMKDGKAYIGVGGGITWESNPEEEYEETLTKAKALFKAIRY